MYAPIEGVLIDLDGVIYQSGGVIPGAAEAILWLTERNIPFLFVTNTTSRPRQALVEKLAGFGISSDQDRILTPPVAAASWLSTHAPGPIALFVPEATKQDFSGTAQLSDSKDDHVSAVVLGDLGTAWTYPELNQAFRLLMQNPKPVLVALGMTRYWQTKEGLSLDVGPFVKALEYAADREAVILGKPSGAFFETALTKLGCDASRAIMIGDDVVGDIDGAQACGIRGILVRTGKFRPSDLNNTISPTEVLDSIAELPSCFQRLAGS